MNYKVHVYVDGRDAGSHVLRRGQDVVVGRDVSCDLVIQDRSVSRRHCRLRVLPEGLEAVDLGSANGIWIDGKNQKRALLEDGDQFSLGVVRLAVSGASSHTGVIRAQGIDVADDTSSTGFLAGPETPFLFREPAAAPEGGESSMSQRPEYRELAKERLLMLVELGKDLGRGYDLEALLNRILDHLFEVLPVKRAVIALTEDGSTFSARVARPDTDTGLSRIASQGVLKEVVAAREGRIIEDAALDQKLKGNVSVVASNIRAAVCAPILVNERCLGAIYADYPGKPRLYEKGDLDFLTAFGSIAGVSLENARMTDALRKGDRLKRDLEIAAEIQLGILPNEAFEIDGLEIDWTYMPSLNIGGDFYDVIELPRGRVAFIIGDVSGKSVPAALYMSRAISILRAVVSEDREPGEVLTRTNRLLGGSFQRVIFATAAILMIDPEAHRMSWSSAGHNPVLVRDALTGRVDHLESVNPPLGVLDDVAYETRTFDLRPGSFITLYTDGLTEVRDREGRELGVARVSEIVAEHAEEPVQNATRAMLEAIKRHHAGSSYMTDDVAILNVRVL